MSRQYDPDGSLIDPTRVTVLLSERDVAGQIPIDFVTVPSVSLKAACFGNNVYETNAARKCISNLLAVGYRRLAVDLYWSAERRTWSLCPVTVPSGPPSVQKVGPYSCSDGIDIINLVNVLQGFFQNTNSQVNVYTTYIILNLHAARSDAAPDKPPSELSSAQQPNFAESVEYLLDKSLGMYIYNPGQLHEERSNLNDSWYAVDDDYKPIVEYFTIHEHPDGTQSTPNGWPSSKYVQLAKQRRVLFGYGFIDPRLGSLDSDMDNNIVFPSTYLTTLHDVSIDDNYTLESGCIFDPEASLVPQVNSSWAISTGLPVPNNPPTPDRLQQLSSIVTNLTSCGISPFLNTTILNATANTDINLYRNISLSASWAWATGEPRDAIGPAGGNGVNRCALMDISLNGHWRAANCSEVRFTACRVDNMPYIWTLSESPAEYGDGSSVCPYNSSFSVPRTGLENSYLFDYALSQPADIMDTTSDDPAKYEIWLDFNSLDIPSCWITGGPEASCPYASDPQQLERRTVLVATIAGIVICLIAALTLFVKCNANRRNSRRRRRVIEGWEYEGVPS